MSNMHHKQVCLSENMSVIFNCLKRAVSFMASRAYKCEKSIVLTFDIKNR